MTDPTGPTGPLSVRAPRLSGPDFVKWLQRMAITQGRFAAITGLSRRTITRYATQGGMPASVAATIALYERWVYLCIHEQPALVNLAWVEVQALRDKTGTRFLPPAALERLADRLDLPDRLIVMAHRRLSHASPEARKARRHEA